MFTKFEHYNKWKYDFWVSNNMCPSQESLFSSFLFVKYCIKEKFAANVFVIFILS